MRVKKRYRVERRLGQGGMAIVYQAIDEQTGQPVALKEVQLDGLSSEQARTGREQLKREANLLKQLDHPGLVAVRDCFQEKGVPYLVTDYVDGVDLRRKTETAITPPSVELVLDWADQLCDVLEYLHAQQPIVLFRDLKPDNIMIQSDGRLRLIDFGIARFFFPGEMTTATLRGYGTPGFAPIEQYAGGTDVRSDIYSLGATLYALLVGKAPPDAALVASGSMCLELPRKLRPDLPVEFERLIIKMMSIRKVDRPNSVAEVRARLKMVGRAQAPSQEVSFCPHRDQTLRAGAGLRHAPFAVAYEGGDEGLARQLGAAFGSQGRAALALFRQDYPDLVPGTWMVLVANPPPWCR